MMFARYENRSKMQSIDHEFISFTGDLEEERKVKFYYVH